MKITHSIKSEEEQPYEYLLRIRTSDHPKDFRYTVSILDKENSFFAADNYHVEEDKKYIFIICAMFALYYKKTGLVKFDIWETEEG